MRLLRHAPPSNLARHLGERHAWRRRVGTSSPKLVWDLPVPNWFRTSQSQTGLGLVWDLRSQTDLEPDWFGTFGPKLVGTFGPNLGPDGPKVSDVLLFGENLDNLKTHSIYGL